MPKKEFGGTVYVRTDEMTSTLLKIQGNHGITPNELTRRLLLSACEFYREHGWFSFPVTIQPEAFQARYVAEQQSLYEAGHPKGAPPDAHAKKRTHGAGPAAALSKSA